MALVRTDVSEEPGAPFIRVTRIGELGTTQAATSNQRTRGRQVPPKHRFLQEPHGVTSQRTPFFISMLGYMLVCVKVTVKKRVADL
jgi:hypothetical protein